MKELIQKLVADYKADHITWHDIQDQVEAWVMQADGFGMTRDRDIICERFLKTEEILAEIECRIGGIK
jgi:hypothetical protein